MSSKSHRIIVLNLLKHKESGIIVNCYSNLCGRETLYLTHPGSSSKSRSSFSQFHPLAVLDIGLSENRRGALPKIKEFEAPYKLEQIRCNIKKSAIALFISELILKVIKEQEHNTLLFDFLHQSILSLEKSTYGLANFHLYFLLKFISHLGYYPELIRDESTPFFDIPLARYTRNMSEMTFGAFESRVLFQLSNSDEESLATIKITKDLRYSTLKEMLRFLSFHTGHDIWSDSLEVLHEVFD